jgi:carbon storage regulator
MLVLTRKLNETIMIADCIQIKVLEFHFDKVKLGINAPISIPILREELYIREKIKKANDYYGHIVLGESKGFMRV